MVWTRRRVRAWERGWVWPVVAVWTAAQTGSFLDSVAGHRLLALFRLLAMTGSRRGQACGLRWRDVDLAGRVVQVSGQLQHAGRQLVRCPLKTEAASGRSRWTGPRAEALRCHRRAQADEAQARGHAGSGYVFTAADGRPLAPDRLTRMFSGLVARSGLPPVRLHGLRHGAATLALLAGTDLKVIADQLGHSSIVLTADTYLKRCYRARPRPRRGRGHG